MILVSETRYIIGEKSSSETSRHNNPIPIFDHRFIWLVISEISTSRRACQYKA